MPRTARASVGDVCYHVINRGQKSRMSPFPFPAENGQAVTFAHDESWCASTSPTCNPSCSAPPSTACITGYAITWAREFRYEGARARYMNRPLDVSTLGLNPQPHPTQPTIWSDYDGDTIHGDFTVANGQPTPTDSYEPGVWRSASGVSDYLHSDMLGTLRQTSNTSGVAGASRVFSAFGERITPTTDRFGYVGAFGYQSTLDGGAEVFPYMHVGARYYDPSSGRFLQRDPIGILGGTNVYVYAFNTPSAMVDPDGEFGWIIGGIIGGIVGGISAAITGENVVAGVIGGGVTGALIGGGVPPTAASAIGGAVTGGLSGYANGESVGGIATGSVVGAATGALGGLVGGHIGDKALRARLVLTPGGEAVIDISASVATSAAGLVGVTAPLAAYKAGKKLIPRSAMGCAP